MLPRRLRASWRQPRRYSTYRSLGSTRLTFRVWTNRYTPKHARTHARTYPIFRFTLKFLPIFFSFFLSRYIYQFLSTRFYLLPNFYSIKSVFSLKRSLISWILISTNSSNIYGCYDERAILFSISKTNQERFNANRVLSRINLTKRNIQFDRFIFLSICPDSLCPKLSE